VHKVCWNGNRKFGWKLLLDGAAMRAWSRHPDCRMPK
jgi:putative IMPACT (imprinted ancient) family translation regulator